ncbi:UBN2_3 domain-containing protein, partial [Cephalotus follicularis]
NNYNQWSHSVIIFICRKGKEDYIIGITVPQDESSARYRMWKVENHMVMFWLLNSMRNEMGENFMYYQTAEEIWDATRETYSNKDNTFIVFEIKRILHDLRQGEMTITDYFIALTRYWQQL